MRVKSAEKMRRAMWIARRVFSVLILDFPRFVRMIAANYRAIRAIRAHQYAHAEKSLLRVYELMAPGEEVALSINMSMCLVSFRLGNTAAAADLALKAIRQVKAPGALVGASATERDYVRYYGKLIYEEATRRDGSPMVIDIGIEIQSEPRPFEGGREVQAGLSADRGRPATDEHASLSGPSPTPEPARRHGVTWCAGPSGPFSPCGRRWPPEEVG